jgi:hypothetical protein
MRSEDEVSPMTVQAGIRTMSPFRCMIPTMSPPSTTL